MKNVADLVDIYEAVFGEPPSAMTRGSLLAMAHAFEITDNDPLGPIIVMSMRSTDLLDAALRQRGADELKHRERLREMTGELRGLLDQIVQVRNARRRVSALIRNQSAAPVEQIGIDRRVSPLLTYLSYALKRKNGVIDRDDRIGLARLDLALLSAVAAICVGAGASIMKSWSTFL